MLIISNELLLVVVKKITFITSSKKDNVLKSNAININVNIIFVAYKFRDVNYQSSMT